MSFTKQFLAEAAEILTLLDVGMIDQVAKLLADTRTKGGRLFILGVGGSAANASHAVNDFRKLAGIEAYAPTDNVSELTARTNDEGWSTVFEAWLRVSRLRPEDMLLILSVGGGDCRAASKRQSGVCSAICQDHRSDYIWYRRSERRLHRESGGCLCSDTKW